MRLATDVQLAAAARARKRAVPHPIRLRSVALAALRSSVGAAQTNRVRLRTSGSPLAAVLIALAWLVTAPAALAQDTCPWCKDDPDLMSAAGIVSHGPIPIGPPAADGGPGSSAIAALPGGPWIFLETAHLRWASSLGETKVDQDDRERVDAELDRLRAVLPGLPKKPRKLDPWLRLHLLAMRGEELYARFQTLLAVTDADFPERRSAEGPYMGDGRFLGERDKFEVVLHSMRDAHKQFTSGFTGVQVTDSLREHVRPAHKMLVSVPAEDADLRGDRGLFPHVAHNLSHMFLCAYKHFSYDPPIWLDEGLAHALEKEIDPRSTTTDGEEGAIPDVKGPKDWWDAARKLAASGKAANFAQLLHAKSFSDLDLERQVAAWSRVRFLLDEHPTQFAAFLGGVKGQLDAQGYPSGSDLPELQRRLLKELFDWTPADFDTAWTAWAQSAR